MNDTKSTAKPKSFFSLPPAVTLSERSPKTEPERDESRNEQAVAINRAFKNAVYARRLRSVCK